MQAVRLVEKHGPALAKTGLLTGDPVKIWKAADKCGHGDVDYYFVDMFAWRDDEASDIAHQTPEVMAIWEPMGPLLAELKTGEDRASRLAIHR